MLPDFNDNATKGFISLAEDLSPYVLLTNATTKLHQALLKGGYEEAIKDVVQLAILAKVKIDGTNESQGKA